MKDIRLATRKRHWAEEKIRIALNRLRGEYSMSELCPREGNHIWSFDCVEGAGDGA